MIIRAKITFSMLATSLASICILSGVFFYLTYNALVEARGKEMHALAMGQKSNVMHVASAWKDRVNLIASRTKLRNTFSKNLSTPAPDNIRVMTKILNDALSSVPAVQYIEMCTAKGDLVVSVGEDFDQHYHCADFRDASLDGTNIRHVWMNTDTKGLHGIVSGPVRLNGTVIGIILATLDGQEILNITQNYESLGETGEILLAGRTPEGDAKFLTPLRYDKNEALKRIVKSSETNVPITQALLEREIAMLSPDVRDYKGTPVMAATAYIPELDWGIVSKIHREEAFEPIRVLFISLLQIALVLSCIVILAGIYLARSITGPIAALVTVARQVQDGRLDVRADASSPDEIGELAKAFNAMLASLQETTAELEEFAYRASHDLRAPLMSALGLLKVTKASVVDQDPDRALKTLEVARSSLSKLEILVQDILNLAKIKHQEEAEQTIDIETTVNDTIAKFSYMDNFDRLNIQCDLKFKDEISLKKSRLVLIIENLISNAIKYQDLEKERSFVKISTDNHDGTFTLSVEDNGLGIEDKQHHKLFAMFQRFHTKTAFGSGLGLYMVKKSADILGGDITYKNTGQGSLFTVTIPLP